MGRLSKTSYYSQKFRKTHVKCEKSIKSNGFPLHRDILDRLVYSHLIHVFGQFNRVLLYLVSKTQDGWRAKSDPWRAGRPNRPGTQMIPFWPLFQTPFKPFPACFGPFLTSLLTPKRPFLAYLAPKWSFLTPYLKGPFESTPGLTHVFDKRPQKGYPKSRSFSCMWRILRVLFQAVTRPTLIKR